MSESTQPNTAARTAAQTPVGTAPQTSDSAADVLVTAIAFAPPAQTSSEDDARERIAALDRETKVLGNDPSAAYLFHEIGLLWEDPLKNPRNAAVAFQNAYKLAPKFLPNIRAARRLFADVGNWQMAMQLIDAEVLALDDPRTRAGLLYEKAVILEERLSRDADATTAYEQSLALKPQDITLLIQLEAVFTGRNNLRALVEVYRLLAAALEDPSSKAHYLAAAGFLLEDKLKANDEAAACFREAFALDRKDLLLLGAIKRVAEREGRHEELLSALAAEAEILGAQAAPTFLEIAKVYQRLDRREDALAALLAARRVSPTEHLVLSSLADIYQREGRHEDLADVLLSWVGSINDESELVALNLRLAALYETELKRDEDAIARYRAILARVPGHVSSLASLGKLYFRNQNWEGLLSVFDAEAETAPDARQKAVKIYKAAEVLEERLGRIEDAIARYNQCLQVQPGYLPAQKSLARLYEKQARYAELVAMYEQDLLQMIDKEQIISTLNKMAVLYEERLSDLDRAVDCLKRILDHSPDHLPTMRNMARLYERAGKWRELIDLQSQEVRLAGDTKQMLSLHHRNAEILDEQLKDRAGATAAYERILQLSPSYLPALKSLGRLYAQDGRWDDLIRMYRAEAEIAPTTDEAAALIHKIGELYEQKLKNENEAIASYQEVLTLAPNFFAALRALGRIYRSSGAWEQVIDVLRSEAANRTDPVERANALFQAAAIWEDQLRRPQMAIEGYQEVLRISPGHATALRALERLYASPEQTKELIAVLDRETQTAATPATRVVAYLKLARIYLDRLNEPSRAAQCCEAVLAIDPNNVQALRLLERLRSNDKARRLEVRARVAEKTTDPKLRVALRLSLSGQDRSEAGLEDVRRAFLENPRDLRLALALERAYRNVGNFPPLVSVYEKRYEVATDPVEKMGLAMRAAEISQWKLNDPHRALAAFRTALAFDAKYLPAIQGARRAATRIGDWALAKQFLEQEATLSRDVRTAIDSYVAAGRICAEQLNDVEGAAALYRKALEKDPLDPAASAALEELLAARGGAPDLAALHLRRGDAKLHQKDMGAAAVEFLAAARVFLDKLGNKDDAIGAVNRALSAVPTLPEALELKGQLALEAQRYSEAAAAFALRAQQGGEARLMSALHLKLGTLYQDQLQDPSRAAAHLQTALTGDPQNVEVLERLANLHLASKNWTGAADSLKRLLEVEQQPPALARHTLALARIHDEGFADAAQASALYRKALELAPGDAAVLERLIALYERTNNVPELVQMLEQQVQASNDPKAALPIRMRIAEVHVKTDQHPKAIETYRRILDSDATFVPARAALADLLMQDSGAVGIAIEEHRNLLKAEPWRLDSWHALFKCWQAMKQNDKAFCASAVLQFFRAANEVEAAFHAEWKNRLGQDAKGVLSPTDVEALVHPDARGAILEVVRSIGDQLSKIYPPNFELLGVDEKKDKLKPDHAVFKAVRAVASVFAVDGFEVFQAKRGIVTLETVEPTAVCVGPDLVRRFNAREQKFILGRATMGIINKTGVFARLSLGESTDLIGNAVRIFTPGFPLGRKNDDATKQIKRVISRKATRELESACLALSGSRIDGQKFVEALGFSADRAGLIVSADPLVALTMMLRDDAATAAAKPEATEVQLQAVKARKAMQALITYIATDDFFRLRQKAGLAI